MEEKRRVPKIKNDDDAVQVVKDALQYIREISTGYGEIVIIVSGGDVKHVNLQIPFTEK